MTAVANPPTKAPLKGLDDTLVLSRPSVWAAGASAPLAASAASAASAATVATAATAATAAASPPNSPPGVEAVPCPPGFEGFQGLEGFESFQGLKGLEALASGGGRTSGEPASGGADFGAVLSAGGVSGWPAAAPSRSAGDPAETPGPRAELRGRDEPGLADGLRFDGADDWSMEELLRLMLWGRMQGMSDLTLTGGDRPWMRVAGLWRPVGTRKVSNQELALTLNRLTRNDAAWAVVANGLELDFGCELAWGRRGRRRFRGNAAAVAAGPSTGLSVVFRALPDAPPVLESLELEKELVEAFFPDNGLVLVAGVMGSGKSTLLAAVLRKLAEGGGRHLATYEAPVEFDLVGLPGRSGPVEQSEVPRHVPSFAAAVRNLARRAADVALIGEARDRETVRGLLEAAEIGVAVYATAHARSVSAVPGRLTSLFEPGERAAQAAALVSSLRLVVQQRLYPRLGGGRLAVRE
ncbi:MAG: Flp pilus assembly complex ATPase component TadA, partial [Deltaproteobacteria bacterium]|nr:Flp pilus assembly complex ATPase component TadA [Deltaproteobacteria bacterium]